MAAVRTSYCPIIDTLLYFARPTAQIFYLIRRETVQAATSTGSGLKGNRLMHLLCKFHTRACYPWRVMLASIL